jgi:CubicO group peptidase (beta-lactamase class C family)
MAVVVTHGPQVVYRKGFGSAGPGRPVTPGTQFRLASLSKSFTALAVLQLVEAGRVGLDQPVQAYLPKFTTAESGAARRITVRHLLNHTSAMADAGFPAVAQYRPESLAQRVRSLRRARLVGEPGREFHYFFDPNYQLLARIVEVVTGCGSRPTCGSGSSCRWGWRTPWERACSPEPPR